MIALALLAALFAIPERDANGKPHLRSETVVVRYADTGEVVLSKNANVVRPIASVTKLLSGLLLTSQAVDREQVVVMLEDDKDRLKWARSRLPVSISMSWGDMLRAGLGASDNRAIYAVVRTLMPRDTFVDMMNAKARELGMADSHFVDPAGLDPGNVSTAMDLMRLLDAAAKRDDLCTILLTPEIQINTNKGEMFLRNPDRLVHSTNWDIVIGKTGYTVEAGRTFAVRMRLGERLVDMVFLGSREMQSVFGDAGRIRRWLEPQIAAKAAAAPASSEPPAASAESLPTSSEPANP